MATRTACFFYMTAGVSITLGAASPASAELSAWSERVGDLHEDDTTSWCTPSILTAANGRQFASSQFNRSAADGSLTFQTNHPNAAQRTRLQCFATAARTGTYTTVVSNWSPDPSDKVESDQCPASRPFGAHARCQVEATQPAGPVFVYSGTNCGNGVTGIGLAEMKGQMTGSFYELVNFWPFVPTNTPVYNNTFNTALVQGTDMGFSFWANGKLWFGFGDTWANETMQEEASAGLRGSVIASSTDLDPSNGITFSGWEVKPNTAIAKEAIPGYHNLIENSAIPTSGFGFSEGGTHYRFLWFLSLRWFPGFAGNFSTWAVSVNGGDWMRGDLLPLLGLTPPVWPATSHFGPGAIWYDRTSGWVYLFGMTTYAPNTPIRLARVKASFFDLMDPKKYQYWAGACTWPLVAGVNCDWVTDSNGDLVEANPGAFGSSANLIPTSMNARPEFSVTYNQYANRFIMLFLSNATANIELWQAKTITGPWQPVAANLQMPDTTAVPGLYGPYMSDHTLRNSTGNGHGQEVYFLMSQWDTIPGGDPYNEGLWRFSVDRNTQAGMSCAL